MALEFEVKGNHYRATKLNAMKQFHLSRKVAPVIPKLVPVFIELAKKGTDALKSDIADLAMALEPFAEALAGMSDEHSEFVVNTCLSCVMRKVDKNYSSIVNSDGVVMFDDMELDSILPIVFKVLWDNLGNFIPGLLSNAPTSASPAPLN